MNQENMDHELEARYEKYKGILKNLQGRSAILDCVVRDGDGRQFDVEIQQDTEGASPKRARYHSGLRDMNTL